MSSFSKTLDVLSRLRDYMESYPGEMLQDALYETLGSSQHEHVSNFIDMFQKKLGYETKYVEDMTILDSSLKNTLHTLILETAQAAKQEVPAFRMPPAPSPDVATNLRGSQLNLEMLI